ncbi:uncharacterized protein LOC113315756 [Papaver somniferum]|uniref:uncharacterized protein LOC113315756 n=1 Tax=Papaver somniferum TaxID=3469 RepID=UPI000E6FC5D7|nr:uncharacterized protein LOC113315756 [Papaver somniferum]
MRLYLTYTRYPHFWFHSSIGLSGGIVIAWKDGVDLEIMHTFADTIQAIIHTHDNHPDFLITFMYGAHDTLDNISQWNYLLEMSSYVNIPWVLIGDLNFTMHDSETHSSVNRPHNTRHVRNFVLQLGLVDLVYSGSDTTWSYHRQGDEHVSVRLDRALVNNLWINNYTATYLEHLVPIASDHSPIILNTISTFNQQSPFKLYKCWFQIPSCSTTINQIWNHHFLGSPLYQFSSKLKYIKTELQQWKKLHFGNIEANLHQIQTQLQLCYDNNLPATHPRTQYLTNSLQTWLSIQREYFMQQASDKFLEADMSTSYFHSMANFSKRRSHIHDIQGPLVVYTLHFRFKYQDLIRLPDADEIKEVVFNIRPWASPGNDGFQAAFYQKCWDTVGSEVISMVQYLFTNKHMLRAMNHTYQVQIPKIHHPQTPSDYRPISICNVSYKIISKIIANRLKPFLSKIISPTQTAYVAGRHIQDNVIIAHELLHTMKTKKIKHALVGMKLDMSKAFDRVEWTFLLDILRHLGFHSDWIALIEQCISTTDISLLINGTPSASFKSSRSLRQGDPLSHYYFLFIIEAFSRLLQHHVDMGLLQDDCLLFFQANATQMNLLKELLHIFGQASGQVGNGTSITIWTSNWIPSLPSTLRDWDDLHLSNYQWVSQLFDSQTGNWDVPLLQQLFTPSQVSFYIAKHQLHAASSIPAFVRSVLNDAWKPPPLNVLKINMMLLTDLFLYWMAEAWALLEAMEMATSNGWSNVVFETDNLNISSYVNNQSSLPPWQSKILLKKCVHICNRNVVWSCVFVYRGCNKVVDALAKAASKHHLYGEWWFNPPSLLIPYL